MNFIQVGTQYINLDNVTHIDTDDRYDYEKSAMRPAVHLYFTSGGTGEDSTAIILFDPDRETFMKRFERTLEQQAEA